LTFHRRFPVAALAPLGAPRYAVVVPWAGPRRSPSGNALRVSGHGPTPFSDRPRDHCGVFGLAAPGEDAARISYFGLYALQHRGQESAGLAVSDGSRLRFYKEVGLVSQVFHEHTLAQLTGGLAVGHVRYSTTGANRVPNAQPHVVEHPQLGPLALCHNGNLIGWEPLLSELSSAGVRLRSGSDSEVLAHLIAQTPGDSWEEVLRHALARVGGAYSLVMLTRGAVYVARDSLGLRPLCLGTLDTSAGARPVVASETCALDVIGATFQRDVGAGELVRLRPDGAEVVGRVTLPGVDPRRRAACAFEYIYFARPDSEIGGRSLYAARVEMGRQLAGEAPVVADLVMGVPDSATPAAVGYAEASGIPYGEGLIKSRYITRTFIQPNQRLRDAGVQMKFNPLRQVLKGKAVALVDDSIVRGTTTRRLVAALRGADAREIHLRVASPPIRWPCFMGIDIASRAELVAASGDVDWIRGTVGADSLAYLSLEGLNRAIGLPSDRLCNACFHGSYPLPVPAGLSADKLALDREPAGSRS
jgi:amidophosphoribosyltransferase